MPITLAEAIGGANDRGADAARHEADPDPAGTQHGTVQRLRGEGPPKPSARDRGDIHYRLEIEIPTSSTASSARRSRSFAETIERPRPARAAPARRAAAAARSVRASRGRWERRERRDARTGDERRRRPRSTGPRRLHDLGRRRARRDAPADPAHVRGPRADHTRSARRRTPASTPRRTSSGCGGSRR